MHQADDEEGRLLDHFEQAPLLTPYIVRKSVCLDEEAGSRRKGHYLLVAAQPDEKIFIPCLGDHIQHPVHSFDGG